MEVRSGAAELLGEVGREAVGGLFHLVKRDAHKTTPAGNEMGGKGFHEIVEIANRAVVIAAGILELIFDADELLHEGEKLTVRFQIGIGFRQGDNTPEIATEPLLGGGVGGAEGAGPGDGFESLPFVGLVAFDTLDECGDQIVAAFQLHLDSAPAFAELVATADEAIVGKKSPDRGNQKKENGHNGQRGGFSEAGHEVSGEGSRRRRYSPEHESWQTTNT